jgi:hypothetical protein
MRAGLRFREAENSAATASIAGDTEPFGVRKSPHFIGFFALARRLLIDGCGSERPRYAAWSKVLAMMFTLGAVSSALDAIQSLTSSGSSSAQSAGLSEVVTDPFNPSGGAPAPGNSAPAPGTSGFSQLSPATMSALLAAQSQSSTSAPTSPSDALQDLFSQIDANGDGQISQSEFENALGAGGTNLAQADSVFSQLDSNGDGSVTLSELSSALKGPEGKGGHHHAHVGGSSGSGDGAASGPNSTSSTTGASSDPLLQALAGASATSVANGDGSTTTSLTYANGSKVTMTSPAATKASTAATSSYNLIEQMIQREAQAISFLTPSLSVSA